MGSLLVTGAGGFAGRRLVRRLRAAGHTVTGLDRSPAPDQDPAEGLRADLNHPEDYAAALRGVRTVLHLAAATGKASRKEHFRSNARGTECLLEQCREAGVERLLFVSTIAVKFPDKRRYYYAQAKARAEAAVRDSGLSFVIVRPTILVGPGAAVLAGLQRLASLPVIPVFGNGRVRVQPLWIDDLIEFIVDLVDHEAFEGQTIELGGPAPLTIEELLQEVRRVATGRRGRTVHIPLGLVLPLLAAVEATGFQGLPVSVGQLSSFRFDGTIADSEWFARRRSSLKDTRRMLELSLKP